MSATLKANGSETFIRERAGILTIRELISHSKSYTFPPWWNLEELPFYSKDLLTRSYILSHNCSNGCSLDGRRGKRHMYTHSWNHLVFFFVFSGSVSINHDREFRTFFVYVAIGRDRTQNFISHFSYNCRPKHYTYEIKVYLPEYGFVSKKLNFNC